jgi:cytochrome c
MAASLEGNKLVAAILTAGIIASGSGVLSRMLYSPHQLEEPVLKVELPGGEDGGAAAEAEEAQPLPVLLAAADPTAGEKVAKKCISCHDFNKDGPNKVGPNLWGVIGRPIASHEGFSYSGALADKSGEWTWDDLDQFIASPKEFAPGTKMSFAGIKKEGERADLLAYLRTLSDNPVPLPEG